jgi:hypothetical protein
MSSASSRPLLMLPVAAKAKMAARVSQFACGGRPRRRSRAGTERPGRNGRVVTMPCTEEFDAQPVEYREGVLPSFPARQCMCLDT